jgi:hypothetical protein
MRLDSATAARSADRIDGFQPRGDIMPQLNAPTQLVFLISLALAILAVLGLFVTIPFVSVYAFWVAIIAYVVLAAGCVMKNV